MDMLAYMLGKQAGGGGGGGGNADYYPILPSMLMSALWEPGQTWEDDHFLEFSMDWGDDMGGEYASYYGQPGSTITITVTEENGLAGFVVATYGDYVNQTGTPIIYENRMVHQGETFTFTMPNTAVVFETW